MHEQMNLFEGIAAAPGAGSEPATQPITEQLPRLHPKNRPGRFTTPSTKTRPAGHTI